MDDYYEMWQFRFKDKDGGGHAIVFARTEETALEIIKAWNEAQDIFFWIKQKFRYKKRCYSIIPPYELEQEQFETIMGYKEHKCRFTDEEIEEMLKEDE